MGTLRMRKPRAVAPSREEEQDAAGMVPPEGMGHPKRGLGRGSLRGAGRRAQEKPCGQGQGPAANTSRMPRMFGARSDKGVMSAPGEREQILGRALGREGIAGAPVPVAAEPPRMPAGSLLLGQPPLAACPHLRSCRRSGAGQGHLQPPPHRSQWHHHQQETAPQLEARVAARCASSGVSPLPTEPPAGSSPRARVLVDGARAAGGGSSPGDAAAAGPQHPVSGSHEPN